MSEGSPTLPLLGPELTDEAAAALAANPDTATAVLAALARDQARLARAPAIAAAIYANPAAPLSTANLVVVTCRQAGVVPDGIPAFDELAHAIAADPTALDAGGVDAAFADLLGATRADGPDDADGPQEDGGDAPAAVTAGTTVGGKGTGGRRSATIDFTRLKLYEKIRLATLGNAYCRRNLLRDANRMVAMAAIRSPQITDGEVAKAAANRGLSEDVIRYIANRKELVKQYPVKLALVGNPKCPLAVALRLLPMLHADDVKQIARSKNVPGALSVAAKRLAAARGPQ